MDIRQSPLYAQYMKEIGWKVEKVGLWNAFIKQFPIIGSFIKIQRIGKPFPIKEIINLAKKYQAFKVVIEPNLDFKMINGPWSMINEIYSPSKTILIDLTSSEQAIFNRFSEAKRRAVRRAEKNDLKVEVSTDFNQFIKLKSKQMFPLGFLFKREIKALWEVFGPVNATLLLSVEIPPASWRVSTITKNPIVAGLLLLFYQKTAYYWLAAATKEGKKLFAPTLLVWEALKLSKKKGCKVFDFEGIYDPRFPKATKSWKGFTKFKEGFGGKELDYPIPLKT